MYLRENNQDVIEVQTFGFKKSHKNIAFTI